MTLIYELNFFVFTQQLCVEKKNVIISKNVVKVEFGLEDVFIGVSNRCTVRIDIVNCTVRCFGKPQSRIESHHELHILHAAPISFGHISGRRLILVPLG